MYHTWGALKVLKPGVHQEQGEYSGPPLQIMQIANKGAIIFYREGGPSVHMLSFESMLSSD